jgi:hypothetical protein
VLSVRLPGDDDRLHNVVKIADALGVSSGELFREFK